MKKIAIILTSLLLVPYVFADIEIETDRSIIDELEKQEVKELDFDFKLQNFESCEDLENVMEKYIKTYWENNKNRWGGPVLYKSMRGTEIDFAEDMVSEEAVESNIAIGGGEQDFSKTNIQVTGVDESDIVKTDGKYLYYFNDKDKNVYIVEAKNLEIIKKIQIPSNFHSPVLYIAENRLIIVSGGYSSSDYSKYGYWINRNAKTYTIVYDTTDIKKSKLIKLYMNDGNLKKSRKIGDYLYIISNNNFSIPYYSFKEEKDIKIDASKLIPKKIDISKTYNKEEQNLKIKGKNLPYNIKSGKVASCNEIEYALPDEETLKKYDFSPSYNIVSIINIKDQSKEVKTKVIAGNNSEIYMSLENMYLTSNIYQSYDFKCSGSFRCFMPWYPRGQNTLIHKLNIDKNSLKYQDSTIIPGNPLTQYSMDEYKGNFRILTKKWEPRETALYILDKNLELKSSLTGLGTEEDFKSSRYIGDKLFLVTFKQVDPLFVIDLADIEKPKILGELKIPGYSTYLHPYDENHLIGLGYDTKENQWGGTINHGVKVDLYEVNYNKKCGDEGLSDEEKEKCENGDYKGIIVKQKHSLTMGERGSYSEALNNPRMFMYKASENKLFLPVKLYKNDVIDTYRNIDFFQGLSTISIDKNNGISEDYRLSHLDTSTAEEERQNECSKYTKENIEKKCVKLINGEEYCEETKYRHVPKYCYADSPIGEYIASKSWNYKDSFIKRALWIGDKTYSISNEKIMRSEMDSGEEIKKIKFK